MVIPTYNRERFLGIAIASALRQTFTDFELIILDDASSDGTQEVARSFGDRRVSYIRNPINLGMVENWNRGFRVANSRYVAFLHDDDVWEPAFLERAMRAIEACPDVGLVYSRVRLIDQSGKLVAGGSRLALPTQDRVFSKTESVDRLVRRNEISPSASVVSRDAFSECGGFQPEWPFHMDWQLWIKIAARRRTAFLAETLAYDRSHPGRLTAQYRARPLAIGSDRIRMLRETIPALPLSQSDCHRLLRRALISSAQDQLVAAWDLAMLGQGPRARIEAGFAFQIDRAVAFRVPLLVIGAYMGSYLPARLPRFIDRWRAELRPFVRRD